MSRGNTLVLRVSESTVFPSSLTLLPIAMTGHEDLSGVYIGKI